MEANNRSFLGRGWSFPPSFDEVTGSIEMVEDVVDINQSLDILLSTSLGERVMRPTYGANMSDYQFEAANDSLIGFLQDLISNAILFFEPRIAVEDIQISQPGDFELLEGTIRIDVEYSIPGVNSRFNYVYDFYLQEADQPI